MDYRPNLNKPSTAGLIGTSADVAMADNGLDQAIFTSIRSPQGEGYRVVAASPGVTSDERVEIARRAPSHGALQPEDGEARGMIKMPLRTGRTCIAHVQFAGKEHTGRGGLRVFSHCVIMNSAAYARFNGDALDVHASLERAVGGSPDLKPPVRLDPLALTPIHRDSRPLLERFDESAGLAATLLRGESVVVTGAPCEWPVLAWGLRLIPVALRRLLTVSANLTYSPSRRTSLCWTCESAATLSRATRGTGVVLLDTEALARVDHGPCSAWLAMARNLLANGQHDALRRITEHEADSWDSTHLARRVDDARNVLESNNAPLNPSGSVGH